jgi:hypothetical protein
MVRLVYPGHGAGHLPIGKDGLTTLAFSAPSTRGDVSAGSAQRQGRHVRPSTAAFALEQRRAVRHAAALGTDLRKATTELLAQGGGDGWKSRWHFFHRIQ